MSLFLRKKQMQLIGIDIGSRFIKAILLGKKGDAYIIDAIACEAIKGDAFQEREIKELDAVGNALRKIKAALKSKEKNVILAVSGSTVINKVVQMEMGLTDVELEAQIEIEADSLIPYPIDEVYIDFEELGPSEKLPGRADVLLSVAHKNIIDSRMLLVREQEFEPKVMDIEGYALGNAFLTLTELDTEQPLFCLCIGAAQLQLTVVENGQVLMSRELAFGTDSLVMELSMAFGLDKFEAAQQLIEGTLPDTWRDTVYPQFLSTLQLQVNRILQLYMSTYNRETPKHLYICGGAVAIDKLVDDLAMDMGIKAEVFDPLAKMKCDKPQTINQYQGAQFSVAVGLALRSFDLCHI